MNEIITLDNGVRLVLERIPYVRSAAIGIWVECGTRHEQEALSGISHFIEHMVFKGTKTRTATQIAEEMDSIGGAINAFTAMQCTCFYAKALDTHICLAADVLCDLYFDAVFNNKDIALERGVVFEEIGMYEDSPEDLVTDRLMEKIYVGTPLGKPILGTKETLLTFDHDILHQFLKENYTSEATVISVSGSFDDELITYLKKRFSAMPHGNKPKSQAAAYHRAITCKEKDIEQNHLVICFPTFSYLSEKRYALRMLNSILGGGMSSRLFQKVRERAGLCYSITTFANCYEDTGTFDIYTALGKDTEEAALHLIREEIEAVCRGDVTEKELDRAREQYKANLLMGMESTGKRMTHQAYSSMRYGKVPSIDELLYETDIVTLDDVCKLAQETFQFSEASFSGVGVLKSESYYEQYLK